MKTKKQTKNHLNRNSLLAVLILGLTAAATLADPVTTRAQSTSNIVQSAESFFASFNTNYTWTNVTLEVSSGYAQVAGANAASKLDAQVNFGNARQYDAGCSLQFSGLGSAVNAAEARFGYAVLQHYDTKAEAVLLAGYDNTALDSAGRVAGSAEIEPALELKKKPTPNTFALFKVSLPVKFTGRFNTQPTVEAAVGFTY